MPAGIIKHDLLIAEFQTYRFNKYRFHEAFA